MRLLPSVVVLASYGSGFLFPALGAAFCRTTTVEPVASGCPEVCQTDGLPLYWPKRHLSYILNERGFPNMSDKDVRGVLDQSFGAWQEVDCDQKPIDLLIEQLPGTTTLEAGPKEAEPNDNAIVHIPQSEWQDDPRAFAITKIWFSARSGYILGADMLFNGGMDPFGICPASGCRHNELTDLANVATHEAGHFLGLAHSDDPDSTMWCDAAPGDTDKRTLGLDDVDGICAIYGPGADPGPPASNSGDDNGMCSARPGDRGPPGALAWLGALTGLLFYRRRPFAGPGHRDGPRCR